MANLEMARFQKQFWPTQVKVLALGNGFIGVRVP
jgi:hypothetical protein